MEQKSIHTSRKPKSKQNKMVTKLFQKKNMSKKHPELYHHIKTIAFNQTSSIFHWINTQAKIQIYIIWLVIYTGHGNRSCFMTNHELKEPVTNCSWRPKREWGREIEIQMLGPKY